MKTYLIILCLMTAIAGAKTLQTASHAESLGESLVDGAVDFRQENTAKMTLVGPTAKSFFEKLSESRITSIQPTTECRTVTIKSGDTMECGHCEKPKHRSVNPEYWCSLGFDSQFGKALANPTFGSGSTSK